MERVAPSTLSRPPPLAARRRNALLARLAIAPRAASLAAMKFEHFALNVPDVRAHAQWYVAHAGFRILRQFSEAPWTTFLADGTGRVVVELYSNPKAVCHDFARQHPLLFHFALVSTDVAADRAHFEKAEATLFVEETLPDGTKLTMLRDPWGVALQLCQRTTPFAS